MCYCKVPPPQSPAAVEGVPWPILLLSGGDTLRCALCSWVCGFTAASDRALVSTVQYRSTARDSDDTDSRHQHKMDNHEANVILQCLFIAVVMMPEGLLGMIQFECHLGSRNLPWLY
jgi:hypothetical protein